MDLGIAQPYVEGNMPKSLLLVITVTLSLLDTVILSESVHSQTPANTMATATATISGGKVTGISITNPGSGYASPPTVAFTGGAGGGATATATISGGMVTGISITNPGSGYASPPTVTFTGGDG